MADSRRCQSCSRELQAPDTGPVCPACMLEQGLTDESRIETIEIVPGRTIGGHEIVRKLGVGGMGVVYEARHLTLRRSIALKMIRTPSAATPKDMARFRQEAEAAARLNHPNIVEVYEIGEFEGSPYFTMKYVAGAHSLGSRLAQGPFSPGDAAQLVCQIARAVAYAHQRGVIHRDLKPANILIDLDECPCIVDFGLAKLFGQSTSLSEAREALSEDGQLMGTPHYMSPEQVRGDDLTTSTDVYSLGVVLYELLAGAPPFRPRSLNDILQQISETSPKPPESPKGGKVPRDLQVIALKCLRKQTKNRYASAGELADDLERWLEQRPIRARPSSRAGRFVKWVRRNPGIAALSSMVAILAIVTIGLLSGLVMKFKNRVEDSVQSRLDSAAAQRADNNKAGRRWTALDSIRLATENLDLLPKKDRASYRRELQNEAVACLSLIDLRVSEEPGDTWGGDPAESGIIALSPDFSKYAHLEEDGSIVIRKRPSYDVLYRPPASDTAPCRSLQFNRGNGLRLAAVHELKEGTYRATIWDLELEEALLVDEINAPGAIDFSQDGSMIVYASNDTLFIATPGSGGAARELKLPFRAGLLKLSHDAKQIAASPLNGTGALLINLQSELINLQNAERPPFDGPRVTSLDWNPRGRWLAMGCEDGRVEVWDTEAIEGSAARSQTLQSLAQRSAIEHVAWHPRGVLLAGSSNTAMVHLWHVAKGELEVTWDGNGTPAQPQFSRDGAASRLGPILNGEKVSLLEVAEGRIVSHAGGHPGKIFGSWWRDLGDTQPARIFATAGDDGVRIWNRRGFEKAFIDEPDARAAIFSDRSLIISGRNGVSIRPVTGGGSLNTSPTIRIGRPHRIGDGSPSSGADFHPESRRLAVASGDEIKIYAFSPDPESAAVGAPKTLPALLNTTFVDISPDGKWVAAGSENGHGVRVWETASWKRIKKDFPVDGSANVIFYHDVASKKDWFVINGAGNYEFFEVGSWDSIKTIPSRLPQTHGAISFSPRTPVFAVSETHLIKIYLLHEFTQLMDPDFDSHEPVVFSPLGFILTTADHRKTHLHLWDLRLLRSSLNDLGLDLGLDKFPSLREVPEPPLIDSVIVEEG